MQPDQFNKQLKLLRNGLCLFVIALMSLGGLVVLYTFYPESSLFTVKEANQKQFETSDSLSVPLVNSQEGEYDLETGFIEDVGMSAVVNNCTNCHSARLVTQNRMSREAWKATIKWMQETQNLWDLGEKEPIILDYLAKNYAPESKGRRQNLTIDKWYVLEQ